LGKKKVKSFKKIMIKYYNSKFKSNKWLTIYGNGRFGKRNFCQIVNNNLPLKKVGEVFTNIGIEKGEETRIIENIPLVRCSEDLIYLIPKWERRNKYYHWLEEPEYHTIYLHGEIILILDRDKFSLLANFQMEISSLTASHVPEKYKKIYGMTEYEYMRGLFGLSSERRKKKGYILIPP
jgi:hypothetical protein